MTNPTTPTIRERAREGFDRFYDGAGEWEGKRTSDFLDWLITLTQEETREKILAALPEPTPEPEGLYAQPVRAPSHATTRNLALSEAREIITNLPLTDS